MDKTIWDKELNLKTQGIFGCVWQMEDYNEVLKTLLAENKVILGGDILILKDGKYTYESSSWYYNGNSSVDSNMTAKEYLSKWNQSEDLAINFVIKS